MKRMDINDPQLRRNAMRVPDGYFDSLAKRVMEQVDASEKTVALVPERRRWWLWSMGAAAAVALVMGFVQVLPSLTGERPKSRQPYSMMTCTNRKYWNMRWLTTRTSMRTSRGINNEQLTMKQYETTDFHLDKHCDTTHGECTERRTATRKA